MPLIVLLGLLVLAGACKTSATPQPATEEQSSSITTQPATEEQSSSATTQPATDEQSSSATTQPATDEQSSSATTQPATDEQSSSTTTQPATDEQSSSTTTQPATEEQSSSTTGPPSAPATGTTEETSPQPAPLSESRTGSSSPSPAELEQLPSCVGAAFTTAPVDLALLNEITPLGNLAPPDHTTPTEHTYLHFADEQDRTTTVYPLYAPADVTLLLIRSSTSLPDPDQDPEDYSITFALCKDVYGYFDHVKFLSDEIAALLADRECLVFSTGDNTGSCEKALFEPVSAGTLLGQVGRLQGNFDFGALDMRVTHSFANDDRYQHARTPNIVCPYDYYEGELREQLYALLPRTVEPRCGVVALDLPGTLQGVWFGPGSDVIVGWDSHLSFVPDNYDPTTAVIAADGVFTEPGRVEFTPTTSGTINRAFLDVTADGTLYCYERDGTGRHEQNQYSDLLSGKFLVQLVSATELKIERQSGRCGVADAFAAPASYFR